MHSIYKMFWIFTENALFLIDPNLLILWQEDSGRYPIAYFWNDCSLLQYYSDILIIVWSPIYQGNSYK